MRLNLALKVFWGTFSDKTTSKSVFQCWSTCKKNIYMYLFIYIYFPIPLMSPLSNFTFTNVKNSSVHLRYTVFITSSLGDRMPK